MPMPIINDVQVQDYDGSLLALNLLSGTATNLVLSAFGPESDTEVSENNNVLVVGETVTLGSGQEVTVLGSGTAQPGVNILGLTVPTGTAVPFILVQDTVSGQLMFMYPEGVPNLLGAVALVVTVTETNYSFPGGVICFAQNTPIQTDKGLVAVQDIRPGMRLLTADNGYQQVVWASRRVMTAAALAQRQRLRPILIRKGALGPDAPEADLYVSPQRRVVVQSRLVSDLFAAPEILLAAKHLVGLPGIEVAPAPEGVIYHHLLLERHEVVFSAGLRSESLFTGPEALRALTSAHRAEVFTLFPDLRPPVRDAVLTLPAPNQRPLLSGRDGRALRQAIAAR